MPPGPLIVAAPSCTAQRSTAIESSTASATAAARSSAPADGITTRSGRPMTRIDRTCRTSRNATCHVLTTTGVAPDGRRTRTCCGIGSMYPTSVNTPASSPPTQTANGPVHATSSVRHSGWSTSSTVAATAWRYSGVKQNWLQSTSPSQPVCARVNVPVSTAPSSGTVIATRSSRPP